MRHVHDRRAGFSFVDLMAGMFLITIGLIGISVLLVSGERAYEVATQEATYTHATRNVIESIRSNNFDQIATTYQGYTFTVTELGGTGTVTVYTDETASSAKAALMGLPRDLDGDGAATNTDITASYMLLPIEIEISWPGTKGTETRNQYILLSREE